MDELEQGQEVERMADWSVQFLQRFSSHPANGEYTAGNLANRYIFHCKIRNEQSIADAVKYDMEMERKAHVSHPAVDTYLDDVFPSLKKKAQRALAVSLENNPNILYDGDRRGRLYRFKTTRPSIRARDVAVFISYYLYQNPEELNIRYLGEEVREWATDFHMKIEHNDQTGFYRSEPNKPYLLALSFYRPQTTDFPFSFNHPDVKSKYKREYGSDLLEWCKNVYTETWFKYSFSNILRYLRKELDCISEGSKRGLWIHQSHSRKNANPEEVDFNDILEFDNHYSRLHNRVLSFKDPDVVPIMLKQLEVQLELMLIRIKKSQQSDSRLLITPRGQGRQSQESLQNLAADIIQAEEFRSDSRFELYVLGESVQGEFNTEEFDRPRIREKIKKFLGDRPRNTAEILEHINSTMRHGSTAQQLGNILSKDKNFIQVGYIGRSGILSGGYVIQEWATRNWVSSNCPGWEEGKPITIDDDGNVTTGASTD